MTNREKYIAELKDMNKIMKSDIAAGKKWVYSNGSIPSGKTFDEARSKKHYATNCAGAVQWGLLRSGVIGTTRKAIQWYGAPGSIRWLNSNAKKDAETYFDIIPVHKTVNAAIKAGTLQPGDILTYDNMAHTNVYLGNKKSFDSGHAYCKTKVGDGAEFTKWIGNVTYGSYKINCILRLKLAKAYKYRARVGIFSVKANADNLAAKIKAATKWDCFMEEKSDGWHVYCGSYNAKLNAQERRDKLKAKGFNCVVESVPI